MDFLHLVPVYKHQSVSRISFLGKSVSWGKMFGIHLIYRVFHLLPLIIPLHSKVSAPLVFRAQFKPIANALTTLIQLSSDICRSQSVPIVIVIKDNFDIQKSVILIGLHNYISTISELTIIFQWVRFQFIFYFFSILIIFWQVFIAYFPYIRLLCFVCLHIRVLYRLTVIVQVLQLEKLRSPVKRRAFPVIVFMIIPGDRIVQCDHLRLQNIRNCHYSMIQGIVIAIIFRNVLRRNTAFRYFGISFLLKAIIISHLLAVRSKVFMVDRQILNDRLPAGVFGQDYLFAIFLSILIDLHPYFRRTHSLLVVRILPYLLDGQVYGAFFFIGIGYGNTVLTINNIIVFQCFFSQCVGTPAAIHTDWNILKSNIPAVILEIGFKNRLLYRIAG